MGNKKLHPSIEKFKSFVKEHPKLMDEVKNGTNTLQEFYEDWYLLGENDPYWDKFIHDGVKKEKSNDTESSKDEKSSGNWMSQINNIVQKMDANQMQHHLNNLSQVIASVQGVLSQFQGGNQTVSTTKNETKHPFSFRKD
ncbi:hypothetical protein J6TS2_02170 [Heyndrickxia sporothermodurans]|nr:hypothetical protein J6TS2_02170 [Heyndrickxia sporothermodurans]